MRSIRPRRELAITALFLPALFPLSARAAEPSDKPERQPDVDELVSRLKDSSARTRYPAAKALGELGPAAKKAVPALARAVADEDESVRAQAAHALGEIGPEAKGAVPALARAVGDKYRSVRAQAAQALGEIGPEAKGAVLALRRALTDSKSNVRQQAAWALGEIGPEAKSAALQLANSLRDSDEEVRRWAAWALGKIGPAARPAVPALTRALERGDEEMRTEAEWALGQIAKWEWRPPEKKRIELLRKRVITDRGAFRLHTMNWTVQTTVSPEFTAELALFMDIFAGFFGRVAVFKRRALVTRRPKVIVYAKQGEFKAATGDSVLGLCDFEIDAEGRWKKFGFSTYARDEDERSFPSFHHDTLLHEGSHVFL
ncbi:MAG: HEAT repeat domain-containing protein, partial [Planctomycetota bacterium]